MRNPILRFAVRGVFALALVATGVAAQSAKPANVAGKWDMSFEGPQGPITRPITFEQDGEKVKGSMEGRQGPINFEGTIKGNKLEFTVERPGRDGQTMKIKYTGTVENDAIKGSMETPQGARDWTAKRSK
jgi:hypothetical protein